MMATRRRRRRRSLEVGDLLLVPYVGIWTINKACVSSWSLLILTPRRHVVVTIVLLK